MKLNQAGSTTTIIISTLSFLAVVFLILSSWALYKYNEELTTVAEQVDAAVEEARADQQAIAEEAFEEERRDPYRTYRAPDVFGGISVDLPKNWNIYVEDSVSDRTQIDLFIHPDMVRVQKGATHPYAFRLQLNRRNYADVVDSYQRQIEREGLRSRAVTVSDIRGVRLTGQITKEHAGSLVILPFRDKTIMMWTEGNHYRSEFDIMLNRARITR